MNEDDSLLNRIASCGNRCGIMPNIFQEPYSTPADACVDDKITKGNSVKKKLWQHESVHTFIHYFTLLILGLLTWGILWCAFGDGWRWDGQWFRMTAVAVIAWGSGQILESLTTLPPLIAALLTGMLARHFGFLDMRHYSHIDAFLRMFYPVIILGKGSLGWDVNYMKTNWRRVVTLGALPWAMEVTTLAICVHLLLGFPWLWGIYLYNIIFKSTQLDLTPILFLLLKYLGLSILKR